MSRPQGVPDWNALEIAYLRENYGKKPAREIAVTLGRTLKGIYAKAAKLRLASPEFNHYGRPPCTYFQQIDSPIKAYVLGLLTADGWVDDENRVGIDLTEADAAAVAVVRDELRPEGRLRIYPRKDSPRNRVRFQFGNAQLAADLARYGIVPRKTRIVSWPQLLPPEYENSFICGYFDGDGHLDGPPKTFWHVCCANREFLEVMKQRIEAATGVTVNGPRPDGSIWALTKNRLSQVQTVDAWLHRDVPGLARKRLAA